jgi:hypothetical protein
MTRQFETISLEIEADGLDAVAADPACRYCCWLVTAGHSVPLYRNLSPFDLAWIDGSDKLTLSCFTALLSRVKTLTTAGRTMQKSDRHTDSPE